MAKSCCDVLSDSLPEPNLAHLLSSTPNSPSLSRGDDGLFGVIMLRSESNAIEGEKLNGSRKEEDKAVEEKNNEEQKGIELIVSQTCPYFTIGWLTSSMDPMSPRVFCCQVKEQLQSSEATGRKIREDVKSPPQLLFFSLPL